MRRFALVLALLSCSSPEDVSTPVRDSATEEVAADTASVKCTPERTEDDRPDDADGYQVRVWYVLPSDGKDEEHDKNGRIDRAIASANGWLEKATGGTRFRLDTCDGRLDIGFKRLSKTDAQIKQTGAFVLDQIAREMGPRGRKLYAVYYGGDSNYSCGGGQLPPTRVGHVCAMYLHGNPTTAARPCDDWELARPDLPLGYFELGLVHEIFHTLGAAASCAPNHNGEGHVSDGARDLLHRGPDNWIIGPETVVDIGNDDYWKHGTSCLDVSKSVFFDPLPDGAVPPPGW